MVENITLIFLKTDDKHFSKQILVLEALSIDLSLREICSKRVVLSQPKSTQCKDVNISVLAMCHLGRPLSVSSFKSQ